MSSELQDFVPPLHVPRELVREYPFLLGRLTAEDPFKRMVHDVHSLPPIFYVSNLYPGERPAWVVRRLEDLRTIYSDNEHFSARNFAPFAQLAGEDWDLLLNGNDPPQHTAYRRMAAPLFSPPAIQALDAKIHQRAQQFIDSLKEGGAGEFRGAFAIPFPVSIVLDLLGLPMDQLEQFMEWELGILHTPDMDVVARSTRAITAMFREEISARRVNPRDDLISFAVHTELEGRRLTEAEIVGFCFNLFAGGLDTVTVNLTLQMRHLAENPQHQAFLRANPQMIPSAVDEMLRAFAPVTTFRTCIKATTVNGVRFEVGDKIAMATTLANSDPEAFDAPWEVRLDREASHVTFGFGVHHCLGAHLARRELNVAIGKLLEQLPNFRIEPGHEIVTHVGLVFQPLGLPLTWDLQ